MKYKKSYPRQVSLAATSSFLRVFLFTQSCIQIAQAINTNSLSRTVRTEVDFRDPVIWDASSLYKTGSGARQDRIEGRAGRWKRSTGPNQPQQQQLVDACESKMEVITPYYATNSKGKLRTIINSELMQQAIQVETCLRSSTSQTVAKCNAQMDCGCEQKYKWHRLLVMDPSESGLAKGLFMDWFLFPSNCVCRCKSSASSKQTFLKTIKKTEAQKE